MIVKAHFRFADPVADEHDVIAKFRCRIADTVQNICKIFVVYLVGKQNTDKV